jgi:hypothetical protein
MKCFVAVLLVLVGSALADVGQPQHGGGGSGPNTLHQYADAREAISQPEIITSSSGWDTPTTYSSAPYPCKF